jgi:hypothetical protein
MAWVPRRRSPRSTGSRTCQRSRCPDRRDQLGQIPSGTALANETQFSGCGGFSTLSVSVKKVNLANGSQLWVTLDGLPVGTITLSHGSGSMATYNLGDFGVSMDQVHVYSSFPDVSPFQQILSGASFS